MTPVGAKDELSAGDGAWFASFDEFVMVRGPELARLARMVIQDRHRGDDVAAEVLGRVYVKWGAIARMRAPDAYVRQMLFNECRKHWRRASTRHEQPVEPLQLPDQARPDTSQAQADRDQLMACLRELSGQQRAALVLRFFEDRPDEEIAAVLGISAVTVRSHVHTGLRRLRAMLVPPSQAAPTRGARS